MKKIITILLALLLCFGLTGCATLDYIFNGEKEPAEPEPLPLIYERKIVSEITLEDKENGYYQASLNGMIKFDYFPKEIALFLNGNIANVEPESVVYANVVANDNTTSTWYVATFKNETFNFPSISAGTSNVTVYAEDTKGTMYVTPTTLTITSEKALYSCTVYDENSDAEYCLLNDFGLENGEIILDMTGRYAIGSRDLSGYMIEFNNDTVINHIVGQTVEIILPTALGYDCKGFVNDLTGHIYTPNENGKITLVSLGGAVRLSAIWEIAPGTSTGPIYPVQPL